MTVKFVPPRVPLVDLRTGTITREWYLLLTSLFEMGGVNDPNAVAPLAGVDVLASLLDRLRDETASLPPPQPLAPVPDDLAPPIAWRLDADDLKPPSVSPTATDPLLPPLTPVYIIPDDLSPPSQPAPTAQSLGLGTMAFQDANDVDITGGEITGIVDLAVADGGTGASTAAVARSNLGAAKSGVNSDITSITGLTTALSIGQGGTGQTTASAARTALGAAASGANSDITSLAGLTTALSVAQGGTGDTGTAWTSYVPSVSAAVGSFTTVSATGRYKRIGKTVFVSVDVTITNNGTAAAAVLATLPFATGSQAVLHGHGLAAVGFSISGTCNIGSATCAMVKYDATYPGGSGYRLFLQGVYEAA